MAKKFPAAIAVTIEEEGTKDEYLQIHDKAEDAVSVIEDRRVGIYVLKEVGIASANPTFTPIKRKRRA